VDFARRDEIAEVLAGLQQSCQQHATGIASSGSTDEREIRVAQAVSGAHLFSGQPRTWPRTLYLRVSTADQKPDLQYDGLRSYAAHAGLDIVQDYCEVAVSGRRESRPKLNALMSAGRNHEIDYVLVWKFDHFARSTRHLLTELEEFNLLGVRFVSVQDQLGH
jgi:predicted site-specific integrase-resolvase